MVPSHSLPDMHWALPRHHYWAFRGLPEWVGPLIWVNLTNLWHYPWNRGIWSKGLDRFLGRIIWDIKRCYLDCVVPNTIKIVLWNKEHSAAFRRGELSFLKSIYYNKEIESLLIEGEVTSLKVNVFVCLCRVIHSWSQTACGAQINAETGPTIPMTWRKGRWMIRIQATM